MSTKHNQHHHHHHHHHHRRIECAALFSYAGSEESISIACGEIVHSKIDPLNADDGWIYIEKDDETNGFVPATYVEATEDGKWIVGRVLYDYEGVSLGTVSVKREQIILVNITTLEKDWVAIKRPECKGGAKGHIPKTYVKIISKVKKEENDKVSNVKKIQEHEKTKIYRRRKSTARYSIIKNNINQVLLDTDVIICKALYNFDLGAIDDSYLNDPNEPDLIPLTAGEIVQTTRKEYRKATESWIFITKWKDNIMKDEGFVPRSYLEQTTVNNSIKSNESPKKEVSTSTPVMKNSNGNLEKNNTDIANATPDKGDFEKRKSYLLDGLPKRNRSSSKSEPRIVTKQKRPSKSVMDLLSDTEEASNYASRSSLARTSSFSRTSTLLSSRTNSIISSDSLSSRTSSISSSRGRRSRRFSTDDDIAKQERVYRYVNSKRRKSRFAARRTEVKSVILDETTINTANTASLDKWYTPKVGRRVQVIVNRAKRKQASGIIKKVGIENTFKVQFDRECKIDKQIVKEIDNVPRQDIISSSWARFSGNVPPSFLSCMSGGGAGGADRPVRTVRDVPFMSALARSAKEQGKEVSDIDLQGIFQAFSYKRYQPNQIIFKEGSAGEEIYIILTGKISIKTSGKEINTLSSGAWFGEIALFQRSSRTADCISIGHSCLLFLRKNDFRKLEMEYDWLRGAMTALTGQQTIKILGQVDFFANLSSQLIKRLAGLFVYASFDQGKVIVNEGETGEHFFILVHGTCDVSIERHGTSTTIHTLEAVNHFGEIALVEKINRTATVTAASDVTLLVISASKFENFLTLAPATLRQKIRDRIDSTKSGMVRNIPFFKDIQDKLLTNLASMFKLINYEKGSIIFQEGDRGTEFYVIMEGECLVTSMNNGLLATLKAGDFFGDLALLRQSKRTATIKCKTFCRLLVLKASEFTRFLSIAPELKQKINAHVQQISRESVLGSPGYLEQGESGNSLIGVDIDALCGLGDEKADVAFKHSVEWKEAPLIPDVDDGVITEHLPANILNPKRLFINSFVNEEYYKEWEKSHSVEVFNARIFLSPSIFVGASDLDSFEIPCYVSRKVEKVIESISDYLSNKLMHTEVSLPNFQNCGLKILNRSDYLVERDRTIGHYSCVQETLRTNSTIEFVLIVIPNAQFQDELLGDGEDIKDFVRNSNTTESVNSTTESFASMQKRLKVYTSMVIEDFNGVKFNLSGSKKTYNCLNLNEGSVILTVYPDEAALHEKWCGAIIGGRIGMVPQKCIERLYLTPSEEYNVESYLQHDRINRKRTELYKQSSSFNSTKSNTSAKRRRKSSYHVSTVTESIRNTLDLADDHMMDKGLYIADSHAFDTAITEVENKRNSETLFSTDWIDKVNTGASHVLRQISNQSGVNIGIATDGEIDGSYAHSNAKTLSIPYRLRLNVLKNMKSLFKQSQISDEFESNRKSLESEGSVCILIEVVDAGLTISSCTYRFSSEELRELDLADDCHIMSPWLYFAHDVKQEGADTTMNTPTRDGRQSTQGIRSNKYLEILNLPLAAKLCFTVKYVSTNNKFEKAQLSWQRGTLLGGATMSIYSFKRLLNCGKQHLVLNLNKLPEKKITVKGKYTKDSIVLEIEFDTFAKHVVRHFPPLLRRFQGRKNTRAKDEWANLTNIPKKVLDGYKKTAELVFNAGPSHNFTADEKSQIWAYRFHLMKEARALPYVLLSVDKTDPKQVDEMYNLLRDWTRPKPVCAMELLDYRFSDYRIRQYAVRMMEELSDNELADCMLQLVQVLKFEPYNRSPLAFFLLRRALHNPQIIGHKLFWFLRSEIGTGADKNERFASLLLPYLRRSKVHVQHLTLQSDMNHYLQNAVLEIMEASKRLGGDRLQDFARKRLDKLVNEKLLNGKSILCLGSEWQTRRLIIEKCKVMNSKQKPLWLVFENGEDTKDAKPMYAMYKAGDDLRQDQITLQLLRFMDRLWMTHKTDDGVPKPLDLRLTPYGCISTGVDMGMLEIVTESNTTANIQKVLGSMGAFRNKSLLAWLKNKNPDELDSNGNFKKSSIVVDNFIRSCAGYCVASYVLGLGDRHADNIMMKENGKLFHIDFGHFLGNFKTKLGFKRERTPFVFTPEMAEVMGGEKDERYEQFQRHCGQGFNILRKNASSLIIMMRLMIPAGMPELQNEADIEYLVDKLCLHKNDDDAATLMKKEIKKCLSDTYRRIDNFIHNVKTGL